MSRFELRRRLVMGAPAALAAHGALALTGAAQAQQTQAWPAKPVRVLVAFPPGGLTDAYARMYAEQFTARYGQPAVVENRPGASGNIAIEALTKSAPDGYTVLFSTSGAVWQNRVLYRKLPFDLARDITPVALYPAGALIMAVSEKVPVRNYAELIEYAKKNPVTMGTYSPASFPHMLAEQMSKDHDIQIQPIHYKGEAPMWLDMASGQIQVAVGSYQAFAAVQSRGVRPIGATGRLRCPKLPELPTLLEQGVKNELVVLEGGLPLTAPAGTPEDILRKLAQVALDGSDTPRARALRDSFAIPDKPVGLEETRRVWRDVAPLWIKQAAALGLKLD